MVGALMFGCTRALVGDLQGRCAEIDALYVYKVLHKYPTGYELGQLLNIFAPHIVFLEITSLEAVLPAISEILAYQPNVSVIGFAQSCGDEQARAAIKAGITEILFPPFVSQRIEETVLQAIQAQRARLPQNVVAFLPAKAGSGSTTVALHVAGSLARDWEQEVLIIEADVRSGPLSVLLGVNPEQSVIDALENCSWIDDAAWRRMISKAQGLDLLLAPRAAKVPWLLPWSCQRLLNFVRPRYDTVVVDLPEVVNDGTEPFVTQARCVYIVCTPEIPSLYLVRKRIHDLKVRGVRDNRIGILANRCTKKEATTDMIEKILGRPVCGLLPNDYRCVSRATLDGGLVSTTSELGRAFASFAEGLAAKGNPGSQVEAVGASIGSSPRSLTVEGVS